MIVSCPACRTRYRHAGAATPRLSRCSRCEETFEPNLRRRPYILVAPSTPMARMAIGLDDPTLAPAVAAAAGAESAADPFDLGLPDAGRPEPDVPEATDESPAPADRRSALRPQLVALLLAAAGAAAGYHGAGLLEADPLQTGGAGLAVGLAMGWGWIRWTTARRR